MPRSCVFVCLIAVFFCMLSSWLFVLHYIIISSVFSDSLTPSIYILFFLFINIAIFMIHKLHSDWDLVWLSNSVKCAFHYIVGPRSPRWYHPSMNNFAYNISMDTRMAGANSNQPWFERPKRYGYVIGQAWKLYYVYVRYFEASQR